MGSEIAIGANLLQFEKTTAAQALVCSMAANQMTGADEQREARAAFLKWDTNQDGVLSSDEIEEHMAEICQYFNMEQPDV